ncbi:hypothetical protein [Streptomyces sp. NPDC017448]|uniref:hypothetical protein n=1 Tax=Streptomyces sp. NPDC017448 TaxID=3364996 RepID=UPI0037B1C897
MRVQRPEVLLQSMVLSLDVHREDGMHEWAQITVRYFLSDSFRVVVSGLPPSLWWAENTAVRILYGPTPGISREFVGYVVSPELLLTSGQPHFAGGQTIDVRYTLLGATKHMQSARQRTWRTCTAAYMARQIGQEAGMAVLAPDHARLFGVRQQALQSDFSFLQNRAEEIGWRLAMSGTLLTLTDPRQPLERYEPRFEQHQMPGRQDTMTAFQAVSGETDPSGSVRAHHTSMGLSPAGQISAAAYSAPRWDLVSSETVPAQVSRFDTKQVVQSYTDAASVVQAAASRDLWWVRGSATVDGDVRLGPGCVVQLGGAALTRQYQGRWMVLSAHHRITVNHVDRTRSTFHTDVELGRDQPTSLTTLPTASLPVTENALVGGRWNARRRRA